MQYQLLPIVAVFHVGSVDAVVSGVRHDSVVRPAVVTPIGHCIGRRIERSV